MLLEERVRVKASVVVGAQRIQMLHPRRLDFLAARRGGKVLQPLGLHVDRAAECRDAGEAIDDGVVVGFGERLGVAELATRGVARPQSASSNAATSRNVS